MTNLEKNSSGSFDVLAKNTDMQIGNVSDDEGLDLTLSQFYPIEITITPEGKARIRVFERELRAEALSIEWSLGIPRETEISITQALGVLRRQSLEVQIPLRRIVTQVLEILWSVHTKPEKIKILVPLKGEPKFEIYFEGKPKSKVKMVATLKALAKLLKKGD